MAKYSAISVLMAAGVILAAGAALPQRAHALSTETYTLNPNGGSNLDLSDPKLREVYRNSLDDGASSNSGSSNDGPHNYTFGSPNQGFSFSVGPSGPAQSGFGQPFFGPGFGPPPGPGTPHW